MFSQLADALSLIRPTDSYAYAQSVFNFFEYDYEYENRPACAELRTIRYLKGDLKLL